MLKFIEEEFREHKVVIHYGLKQEILRRGKCIQILDYMCKHYGSSYQGRKAAVCSFLHIYQKAPILISEEQSIIVFPSQATEDPECVWVNYSFLKEVKKHDEEATTFVFKNDTELQVAMNYRSAIRQIQRCNLYLYMMGCHQNQEIMNCIQ